MTDLTEGGAGDVLAARHAMLKQRCANTAFVLVPAFGFYLLYLAAPGIL